MTCACASSARERSSEGVGKRSGRRFGVRAGPPGCENFSPGLLTVKKSVIRFRPADLACQESEQNRHPVAKHNQNIRLESVDGGVGFASFGEMQGHPSFDTCLVLHGRYPRIRHDAHDATAVPARQSWRVCFNWAFQLHRSLTRSQSHGNQESCEEKAGR